MTIPEPNEFRQLDTFPHLLNCTPNLPPQSASCTPLLFIGKLTPGCFCAFNCRTVFCRFLCLLFCACTCTVFLFFYFSFFACQFSRNYPRQFFRGGAFLYSGFNFSHSDLPFPTRCCILYARSGLYQLVIRVKGFRVCTLHCELAITSITHCIIWFCPSAWTPRFQKVELCIASARTTLAVSAVAPS